MGKEAVPFAVGDWVVLGLQAGVITKIDGGAQGLHAVQVNGKQFWRKAADLRPLFGSSGVPKTAPEVGDWVRFIQPAAGGKARIPGATAHGPIGPPPGHTMGQVSRLNLSEGRLCVQLSDGQLCWRAYNQVILPDDDAPYVPLQTSTLPPSAMQRAASKGADLRGAPEAPGAPSSMRAVASASVSSSCLAASSSASASLPPTPPPTALAPAPKPALPDLRVAAPPSGVARGSVPWTPSGGSARRWGEALRFGFA